MSGSTTDLIGMRFSVWGSRREVLQGLSGLISTTARRKCEWILFQKEKEEKDETNHKRLITYIKKNKKDKGQTNKGFVRLYTKTDAKRRTQLYL